MRSLVELRPNKLLLDPSFEGYKLSLDPIPIHRQQVKSGVQVVQPGDDQFSFYHVKIFSLHNHLYVNPYKEKSVYFIDKQLKVFKIILSISNQIVNLKEVYQIQRTFHQQTEIYNASIIFASSEIVLISNGLGTTNLARILGCDDAEKWEGEILFDKEVASVLLDGRIIKVDNKRTLHVLLLHVKERVESKKENTKSGLFQIKLEWKTFIEGINNWESKCNKELSLDGNLDFAALEPSCKSIYLVTDKSLKWEYDSEKPIEATEEDLLPVTKIYTWTQTEEEITIWVPLPDIEKTDVETTVGDLQIQLKVKGKSILNGNFFHRVNKDLTTWSFEKNKLEIQLTKQESGLMWKTLMPDNNLGEEILDEEVVKNIHEKLAHLCSDKEETGAHPSFNNHQLEECDAAPCEKSLVRIHGETHATTHEVSLSSCQWLFNVSCDPSQVPALCLRQDVDACIWQFSEPGDKDKSWPHEHIGTFSAFGYVQASKTQRKFIASAPNLSYVAICESSHHIYIYRQPSSISTELKNRHTGKKVETIAKQQLVNLESKDQILGIHATNHLLFVLLETSLCVLVINV